MSKSAKCSPSFIIEVKDVRAAIGETAKFECQFSGNPVPEITWWHGDIQLHDSNEIRIITEENRSSCEILSVKESTAGFYTCKATNEIGMNLSRGKFSLASARMKKTEVGSHSEAVVGRVNKKRIAKKGTKTSEKIHKSTVEIVPSQKEVTVELMPAEAVKRKPKKATKVEIVPVVSIENKVLKMEVIQIVEELHLKIVEKTITETDIIEIRTHEEVTVLLESINSEVLKAAEKPLRDLATISVLLTYGISISEITFMYETNIFPTLRDPETQSAMVNLVEREGYDELIAQILTEQSLEEDETIVAATVGFRAFIKMIEISNITVEEVITKFVKEDFIAQEWKFTKEKVIDTTEVIETKEAVVETHIRVEQTIIEETTVTVEGLPNILEH